MEYNHKAVEEAIQSAKTQTATQPGVHSNVWSIQNNRTLLQIIGNHIGLSLMIRVEKNNKFYVHYSAGKRTNLKVIIGADKLLKHCSSKIAITLKAAERRASLRQPNGKATEDRFAFNKEKSHPEGISPKGDCVIQAISKALNTPYLVVHKEVHKEYVKYLNETRDDPTEIKRCINQSLNHRGGYPELAYEPVIKSKGYKKVKLTQNARLNPKHIPANIKALVSMRRHLSFIDNGKVRDGYYKPQARVEALYVLSNEARKVINFYQSRGFTAK